ncbi:uncharacterized protein SCHCODRAFT_02603881 [Schizophyllum commune H4-8]|uniref:Uncharacterized protein n=1 Tax=Schizophyllum commune (strain H4-8 / FGSC 9210) TaxID=578458 RepID=D8QMD6_SCHCM|nr:uncharacterized protein SCHCODRAFT_02603881 [Schizophyllum commune H4-8]KAI5836572.1 hypothetical protein SCHCODRAFT_02603881 [Schizophyllum commune H4-8]
MDILGSVHVDTVDGEGEPPSILPSAADEARLMAREERIRHYETILIFCGSHCGFCLVQALIAGRQAPTPKMAHDINICPGLSQEERLGFYSLRRAIRYTHGHHLCYRCHISAMGMNRLHPDFVRGGHPHARVGLPLAWAVWRDPELKAAAFGDLVQSSPLAMSRGHSWATIDGFRAWIEDKDATEEPSSVMALMDFVYRRFM